MGLNDSFSATKLKSKQKYLTSAYISIFLFVCFTSFVLVFVCLKLGTTLFLSFSSFVWCRNWSRNSSCPGAGSEWEHGPSCTSAEISLPGFCRRSHEPVAAALVCPEERGFHVVPHQAGGPQVRLALQKRRRDVNALTPQLETPLVCASRIQADVLWEWQWGKAEGDYWHQKGKVSAKINPFDPLVFTL